MMKSYIVKILFEWFFGNTILKNAAGVISVSKMEFEQVLKRNVSPKKIKIIPNAVDLLDIKRFKKGSFREKYNIMPDKKLVLFLGRIHPIKGIDLLVDAYAELVKKRSDTILVITGPDEGYLTQIKARIIKLGIKNEIIFTGPLYNQDKYDAYNDADIYVLPSRYEIFAISVIEACASGLPVIVTENQGIADFVRNCAGEVIPFQADKLMLAMDKLLSDEDLRLKYGNSGRKMVEDKFTWEKIVDQYEQVYKESCKQWNS